jgi:hypothetical protein
MLKAKTFKWWMDTGQKAFLQVWSKKSGRWVDKTVELTLEDWEVYQKDMKEKYASTPLGTLEEFCKALGFDPKSPEAKKAYSEIAKKKDS